jgi:hypothetical protein
MAVIFAPPLNHLESLFPQDGSDGHRERERVQWGAKDMEGDAAKAVRPTEQTTKILRPRKELVDDNQRVQATLETKEMRGIEETGTTATENLRVLAFQFLESEFKAELHIFIGKRAKLFDSLNKIRSNYSKEVK